MCLDEVYVLIVFKMALIASNAFTNCVKMCLDVFTGSSRLISAVHRTDEGPTQRRAGRLQGSVSHRLPGLWRRASHGKRMETTALNDTYKNVNII